MIELGQIRKAFPNWPSELEVAKQSSNWAMMAQSFYCAAVVLNDEMKNVHRQMHSEPGMQVSVDLSRREQVGVPAIFCLAFSLELAIKAALIHQGAISDLETRKKLPFSSHSIHDLAKQVEGLHLVPNEEQCLEQAASVIANGKYPAGVAPCELKNGVQFYPNYEDFMRTAAPLYERLMSLATSVDAQK
jgi:hypothetical protein